MESYDEYYDYWSEKHEKMQEEIKFSRMGEQWDDEAKTDRIRESRPCLTINKLPSFARQVINDARQNKPSIKTHPADDKADPKTAKIMNGLIRNIEYTSDAEVCYDTALESAVYCSMGFWEIDVDYASYDQFEEDICFKRIVDATKVYGDIYSEACDASDWMRCFVENDPISLAQFEKEYPDKKASSSAKDFNAAWNVGDDVLLVTAWDREEVDDNLIKLSDGTIMLFSDYEEKLEELTMLGVDLQIISQRPTKTYKVRKYLFSNTDILKVQEWRGRYIPIIPVYGEDFYIDGKREFKSMFYDVLDSQRNYNYWRTACTETVALQPKSPYIGREGAFDTDAEKWATANVQNHPYLQYDGDERPSREPPPQVSQGALMEVQAADADMRDIVGIQNAGLGKQSNEIAGVAIDARKIESDTSNFHFVDNLSRAMRYCGRVLLDLIPEIYGQERVIRIMGFDESVQNVPINQPFQEQGVEKIYDISKGKYDLTVEVGASYTTKRKESVSNMMSLVTAFPEAAGLIGDLVAKNMDWDGADDIAKRLKALLPPEIIMMDEMQGIPEEAVPFIANAQKQLQDMQAKIQEGQAIATQQQQMMQQYEVELRNKQGEQALKARDQDLKLLMQQMDEKHEKQLEVIKGVVEQQLTAFENQIGAITNLVNGQINGA